jgi:hypothetical protein
MINDLEYISILVVSLIVKIRIFSKNGGNEI